MSMSRPSNNDGLTAIQQFYKDTNVLITGATGFLGRILLEKLLRSCCVATIYVLVREKKGKEMQERLKELCDSIVFERLRLERPEFRTQIVGIYGDCSLKRLGLAEDDRQTLIDNVELVFHCAATVNFDEQLRMATWINIRGTREMLELARAMRKLRFFAHVSTAYAHCYRRHLAEEFYKSQMRANQLISIVEELSEHLLDQIEPAIVQQFPNTYTFTKSVSEQLIDEMSDFPIAVFRPAIIVSTFKEPLPGWINNYYGPQGVATGAFVGLLRTLHCDQDVDANIVPVDMCVNALIALAWHGRQQYDDVIAYNANANAMEARPRPQPQRKYKPIIYQYESSSINRIDWKQFRHWTQTCGRNYMTVKLIGIYFFHLRRNYYANLVAICFLHYVPAFVFDVALLCTGRKPRMIVAYRKVHKFSSVISYFCTQNWHFSSRNVLAMSERMSAADNELFFCDLRQLNWRTFFKTYLLGCRLYLIKDPIDTIPQAKRLYRKFQIGTYSCLAILFAFVAFLCYNVCTLLF